MAEIESIIVKVETQGADKAIADIDKLGKSTDKAQSSANGLFEKYKGVMAVMQGPVAIAKEVGAALGQIIEKAKEYIDTYAMQEQAATRLGAVLENVGGRISQTQAELTRYASELQGKSLFGDEQIIEAEKLLAVMDGINTNNIKQATQIAVDLAAVMGTDVANAASQVGRALSDTENGLMALRRAGITFTEQEREQIKALNESGKQAEAKAFILQKLSNTIGGTAQKLAETSTGALKQFSNTIGDTKELIGRLLAEALEPSVRKMNDFLAKINQAIEIDKQRKEFEQTGKTNDAQAMYNYYTERYNELLTAIKNIQSQIAQAEKAHNTQLLNALKGGLTTAQIELENIKQLRDKALAEYQKQIKQQKDLDAQAKQEEEKRKAEEKAKLEREQWQKELSRILGMEVTGAGSGGDFVQKWYNDVKKINDYTALMFGEEQIELVRNRVKRLEEILIRLKESGIFDEKSTAYAKTQELYEREKILLDELTQMENERNEIQQNIEENIKNEKIVQEQMIKLKEQEAELERKIQEEQKQRIESYNTSLKQMKDTFVTLLKSGVVEGFESIGRSLINANEGAKNFEQSLYKIVEQILNQLPLMLLNAGLMAISAGNIPVGLLLLGASGVVAIGAGAYNQAVEQARGETKKYAKGGIVSGRVTLATDSGLALAGENGDEAILPLARTSTGELGVLSNGGGIKIEIINQTSGVIEKTEQIINENGIKTIRAIIKNVVTETMNKGEYDGIMASRFGTVVRGYGV